MPTHHTTMCAFGGRQHDILFITSGVRHLTPEERAQNPMAGAVFAVTGLGVTGLPEPLFSG